VLSVEFKERWMINRPTFVIVGASLAGAKAAETLRAEGFDGRVVLIGAEPERPYERPALSKDYLRGESEREKLFVHDERFYAEHDIELRTGAPVTAIEPRSREVVIEDGERLRFDRLLLATGAAVRRLSVPGADLDRVLYLRDVGDADAIRRWMAEGGRAVVIGAGWIGAEVAASLRQAGLEVTVIEMAQAPLERVLGPEVGAVYRDLHCDHGVELLLGTGLQALEGDGAVERVVTTDGRRIDCDFVVAGIGVLPRTDLAAGAGLDVDRAGVLVDEGLETSVAGIFAAGDVTNSRHPLYEGRLHVEHWANALHQGPTAARNMLGRGEAYDRVPYFYSDQYDVGMEYSGHAVRWDQVVFRGDPASRELIAFWLSGDRVLAGMNVNVWEVTDPIQEMIRERVPVDRERLRDPDVPLEEIARARPVADQGRVKTLFEQGINYTRRFVGDRLAKPDPTPVSQLQPGEGKVLEVDGDKAAVYRDDDGQLHALSPVCTHMGCLVEFNATERIWDCPCHGSRFATDGTVIKGPATRALKAKAISIEAAPTGGEAA
jgi:3-phenylpropionate/trans-cinnamate dioxygenase ferredoxin reductase subunit